MSQELSVLYEGSFGTPPTSAPAITAGAAVWVITCGEAAIGCSVGGKAAVEAAEKIGWDATTCDGKLNEGGAWTTCMRQAIAAQPDAILVEAIDCAAIKQPLQEAADAGIPTISWWGYDCDDPGAGGGDPLFTASVQPSVDSPSTGAYQLAIGRARADWVIAKSGGKAKIVEVNFEGASNGVYLHNGFAEGMETCSGCAVYEATTTLQSLGNLRQTVESALLQHPDATYVVSPLDSLMLLGTSQAVTGSSRRSDLTVIGGEGLPPNVELIRGGTGQNAAVAQPIEWWAWGAVDTAARVLAGEEPVPQGMGFQLMDADHNLPTDGDVYEPPVDFRSAYLKAWGVSS